MDWASKVSSVAFAHPDIGEAHADISSGAAEIYLVANATYNILALSYSTDEMGISFPSPVDLQMDNSTAEVFVNDTAYKTKLKHIDVRQKWVQTLRDKNILRPVHVDTKDNAADLFTKILGKQDFTRLRSAPLEPPCGAGQVKDQFYLHVCRSSTMLKIGWSVVQTTSP